jgi:hypothetical protein
MSRFSWGEQELNDVDSVRTRYIEALRAADRGDVAPLVAFVRG